MGPNICGPIRGPWQGDGGGWGGDEPPYPAPVFVLTHYEHEPIELAGGTTFYFVTDGFDAAFALASEAASDRGVDIAGGASTVRQALTAGVIDEFVLDFAPPSCSAPVSGSSTASPTPASSQRRSSTLLTRRTCATASAAERGRKRRLPRMARRNSSSKMPAS